MSSPEDQDDNRGFGVFVFGMLAVLMLVAAAFYMLGRDTSVHTLTMIGERSYLHARA